MTTFLPNLCTVSLPLLHSQEDLDRAIASVKESMGDDARITVMVEVAAHRMSLPDDN